MTPDVHLRYSLTAASGVPTIMFLHGFLGCGHDWDEIAALLGDKYRHLRVNLPGHGSPVGSWPLVAYSMSGYSNRLGGSVG